MSKKKKIIAIVIVAVIGTIVFWKRTWLKNKLGISSGNSESNINQNDLSPSPALPGITFRECTKPPYRIGCSGKHIKVIQSKLNLKHKSNLKVDGYFGKMTEQALINAGYGETLEMAEARELIS